MLNVSLLLHLDNWKVLFVWYFCLNNMYFISRKMTERRNLGEACSEDLRVSRSSNPSVESFANSSLEESLSVSVTFPVKETDSAVALLNEVEATEKHDSVIECAVCLQSCIHPVKLPCSHIFCFLCVKGVAFQSRRCAMCRQEIPADFLLHPQLIDRAQLEKETPLDDGYQWFYEGRNGEKIFPISFVILKLCYYWPVHSISYIYFNEIL